MSERHTSRKPLTASEPEIRSGYDFSGAIRGKYYKRYLESSKRALVAGSAATAKLPRKRAAR